MMPLSLLSPAFGFLHVIAYDCVSSCVAYLTFSLHIFVHSFILLITFVVALFIEWLLLCFVLIYLTMCIPQHRKVPFIVLM